MSFVFDRSKPVAIGADHAGFEYKTALVGWMESQGLQVKDFGTNTPDSVDYPDYAHPVARAVEQGEAAFGVLLCGTANGVAISANKHPGVRAALCWQPDIAAITRQHNDANIICIPARVVSLFIAQQMVAMFMSTEFEGGRHATRVGKIDC